MTISVPMKLRILLWTALAAACAVLGVLVCPRAARAEEKILVIGEAMSRNPAIWQLDCQDYIEFYNEQRPHAKLQYKTPNQKEREYKEK